MNELRRGTPSYEDLRRFLDPKSVAVVGASDRQRRSDNAVGSMLAADIELHLVNPNRDQIYGKRTVPALSDINAPVDAVLCLVNAESAIGVVEEAARTGAGGVVVVSGGFREAGEAGGARERRLIAAAGSVPLSGPNCNGFVSARRRIHLSGSPPVQVQSGGVGVVTQSGAFISYVMLGARERRLGLSLLISSGNEATLDLVDYLRFLTNDPATHAICLVVERLDRPAEFLAAAQAARDAGKPIIALRLARGTRARAIAQSHTGAIVGGGVAVDAAFASAGIISVATVSELLDAASVFEQVEPARRRRVAGAAILTASGGAASLSSDQLEAAAIPLPPLEDLQGEIESLPDTAQMNPLDLTGFVLGRPDMFEAVVRAYAARPELDALIFMWGVDEYFHAFGADLIARFVAIARDSDKLFLIGSMVDSRVEAWVDELPLGIVGRTRDIPGLITALRAVNEAQPARRDGQPAPADRAVVEFSDVRAVPSTVGPILDFSAAMELLTRLSVATAPYTVCSPNSIPMLDFAPPYVVKIANAPHREVIGGVRVGVTSDQLVDVVAELATIAQTHGISPPDIVIQPQLRGEAELFVGLEVESEFGPVVVCGEGGARAESTRVRAARLAPLSTLDATEMLAEIENKRFTVLGERKHTWNTDAFAKTLVGVSQLASDPRRLRSFDINPLIVSAGEPVAVDALCVLRPD